jgi:hypothetical protein
MEERIGQQLPGSPALLLVNPAEKLAGDVNNTNQRLFGYVVALDHETDYRFVHHFIERRLGATLSVTPHVFSAIGVQAIGWSGSSRSGYAEVSRCDHDADL